MLPETKDLMIPNDKKIKKCVQFGYDSVKFDCDRLSIDSAHESLNEFCFYFNYDLEEDVKQLKIIGMAMKVLEWMVVKNWDDGAFKKLVLNNGCVRPISSLLKFYYGFKEFQDKFGFGENGFEEKEKIILSRCPLDVFLDKEDGKIDVYRRFGVIDKKTINLPFYVERNSIKAP